MHDDIEHLTRNVQNHIPDKSQFKLTIIKCNLVIKSRMHSHQISAQTPSTRWKSGPAISLSHRNIETEISAKSEDRITWLLRWKPREPRWQSSVRSSGSRLRLGSGTGLGGKVSETIQCPGWHNSKMLNRCPWPKDHIDHAHCTLGKSRTFVILVEHSLPAKKGSCQPDNKCNQFLMKTSDCQMFSEHSHILLPTTGRLPVVVHW